MAGAESPSPDGSSHLLVVPDSARAQLALERSRARVVARYGEFDLVEADGRDDERLRQAGATRRDDMRAVRLAGGNLDPAKRSSVAGKEAPDRGEALVLVQYVGPVKAPWLARLRATGGTVLGYVAQNGYLVHATGAALDRVTELVGSDPAVRAATPVRAADKIERGAKGGRVAVQTVAGAPGADARAAAAGAGERVGAALSVAELRTQFLELSAAEVSELAADPAVVAIEPAGVPEQHDERGAQVVAGNLSGNAPSGPGYDTWLASNGFTAPLGFAIDVTDDGLDRGSTSVVHPDFAGRVSYAHNYTADADARDCSGHGTNVTSIAAGASAATGSDAQGYKHGLGVAPLAQVGASKIFRCSGDPAAVNYTTLTRSAYAAGARVSNNSWGIPNFGGYAVASQVYDSLVRDASTDPGNQEIVEIFSAGNDGDANGNPLDPKGDEGYGSVSSPGTAKNVITVGAAESVRASGTDGCGVSDAGADSARDIINFSSRGPTQDGRIKPDLVAPGTHVTGASPQHAGYTATGVCNAQFAGSPFYSLVSGTSQAAPHVAGAAALVRDWYGREVSPGTPPSAAMTKAILTNTAVDLDGGDSGKNSQVPGAPNSDQGWGRVSMGAVLDGTTRDYVDQSSVLTANGQSFLRSYGVSDQTKPLRITLAWTDPPPATVSGNAFVNDLDLEVSVGGRTYRGNWLSGGVSIPGGQADFRNNLESVVLPAGTDGRLSVKVVAKTLGGDGVPGNGSPIDQDFALVVSNAAEVASSPVLVAGAVTVDDVAEGQNGDGALEPGESFELRQRVRNTGTEVATGVSGTLTGAGSLEVTQADSAYPDITSGAEQENTTAYAGALAPAASCGVDATGSVAVTSTEGATQTVPLTIPTGRPGPVTTHSRTETRAIPDDDAGGVVSTLYVPVSGRIKDLDVFVNSIDHSFVGDLKIELTSPDNATTVRLVEHPGGPNNDGDDLTGTIFDDEATVTIGAGGSAAPYTGRFRPQADQLSRFDGKEQQGTWKLRVSDRYENDTGTLLGWGLAIRTAQCDPDIHEPETEIEAGPPAIAASRHASFSFSSKKAGTQFQCRLDGGDFAPCTSPQSFNDLPEGTHTFEVRAFDSKGNVDGSPAVHTWTVDVTAPAPRIGAPAGGSTFADPAPVVSGSAGTAAGDDGTVAVDVFAGPSAAGAPVQSVSAPRDGGGGFSARPGELGSGTYTVVARQRDAAGNAGASAPVTFTVARPGPDFAVVSTEESVVDAAAGRVAALTSCDGSCRRTARLAVNARGARKLGLRRRAVRLGSGAKSTGAGSVAVRPTRVARRVLRRSRGVTATLETAAGSVRLKRRVSLRRSLAAGRLGRRGLRLTGVCSSACTIEARLVARGRAARRLRTRSVGTGSASVAAARASTVVVRLSRAARRTLRRAGKVTVTLQVTVSAAGRGSTRATRRITLGG